MKIRSVIAALAAAAVVSTTSVTAFAENDGDDNETLAVIGNGTMVETVADTATVDGERSSDKTGAEGFAALLGVIALAGAAVGISRKKA